MPPSEWEPKLSENAMKPSVCPGHPPIGEEVQMTGLVPMYSYVAAGANQICQEGKCTCVRGFFRKNFEECEGKFLHFCLYRNLYNWAVTYFLLTFSDFFNLSLSRLNFIPEGGRVVGHHG